MQILASFQSLAVFPCRKGLWLKMDEKIHLMPKLIYGTDSTDMSQGEPVFPYFRLTQKLF